MAVVWLKLSVDILLAVLSVDERVQAAAVLAVLIQYQHRQLVVFADLKVL